jgi:hypothetical protein
MCPYLYFFEGRRKKVEKRSYFGDDKKWYCELENKFPDKKCCQMVIMPSPTISIAS